MVGCGRRQVEAPAGSMICGMRGVFFLCIDGIDRNGKDWRLLKTLNAVVMRMRMRLIYIESACMRS